MTSQQKKTLDLEKALQDSKAVIVPNNPHGIDNDTYQQAVEGGFDDALVKARTYKPGGNPFIESLYTKSVTKPVEVDEKKVRASRTATNIGDAIGSLAEIAGVAQGARTKPREFTANRENEANIKDIRNLYLAQNDRYEQGLANARVNDYQIGEAENQRNRAEVSQGVRGILAARKEEARYKSQAERQDKRFKIEDDWRKSQSDTQKSQFKSTLNERNAAHRSVSDKAKYDMDMVTKARSLPEEWQKKMGFLKPVATKDGRRDKTEWVFDNSIRPEVLEAAVKQYESEPKTQQQPKYHTPSVIPTKTIPGF